MLSNLDLKSVPCSKITTITTPKQPYTPGSSGCHKDRPPAYLLGGLLHPQPGDIDDQKPESYRSKNTGKKSRIGSFLISPKVGTVWYSRIISNSPSV